jgi:hypothetical protein
MSRVIKAVVSVLAGLALLGIAGCGDAKGEAKAVPSAVASTTVAPTTEAPKTAHQKFEEVYAERGSKDGDKQFIELSIIDACKQLDGGATLDNTFGMYVALATPGADQRGGVLDPELYVYCPKQQEKIAAYLKSNLKQG